MNNRFAISNKNNHAFSAHPRQPIRATSPKRRDYVISFCAYIAMLIMLGFVIAAETNAFSL